MSKVLRPKVNVGNGYRAAVGGPLILCNVSSGLGSIKIYT